MARVRKGQHACFKSALLSHVQGRVAGGTASTRTRDRHSKEKEAQPPLAGRWWPGQLSAFCDCATGKSYPSPPISAPGQKKEPPRLTPASARIHRCQS